MDACEQQSDEPATPRNPWNPLSWPLYVRVALGVLIGGVMGAIWKTDKIVLGWTTTDLGVLATLYIQLLTTLATPLIFFAIVEAFVHTHISFRHGMRMLLICCINIAVAFAIGLTILNVWLPGRTWQGSFAERAAELARQSEKKLGSRSEDLAKNAGESSLSPLQLVQGYVPKSVVQPFAENMVLTVAVLALLVGAAMRAVRADSAAHPNPLPGVPGRGDMVHGAEALATFERLIVACYQILLRILAWIIELAPYAICLAVAEVVGRTGLEVFTLVGVFFATVVASLALHALVYYPLSAWLVGGKSPRLFFREGAAAILTGFSINSSLATAPLTLAALRRMGVSEGSARLSACVGTNFNNDGITLYEAITALFVAQAAGLEFSLTQQVLVLLAALAGSMGIAGIPNSGLIILTLVLKAAKLPEEVIAMALPIVYSIDFIHARLRSAVNVMGDMQVAVLLDVGEKTKQSGTEVIGVQ
jgi:DAACS family dicarboxylate/amino acid:cation (Na+ or H+) symporter